jgi:hypothetical protein
MFGFDENLINDVNEDAAESETLINETGRWMHNLQEAFRQSRGLLSILFQPIIYLLGGVSLTFLTILHIWATTLMACILFSVSKFDISWTASNNFVQITQAAFGAFGVGDWFSKSWHYLLKRFNLGRLDMENLPFKVTCSKCNSVYELENCYTRVVEFDQDGKEHVSIVVKNCMVIQFPNHPRPALRQPCNKPLLNTERSGRKGKIEFVMFAYIYTYIHIYIYI